MQSIGAQLSQARQSLSAVAGENAALEARVLAMHAWGVTPEVLVREADRTREAAPLLRLVARRLAHEPVAQIIGTKDFWRDTFGVTADVLTPRADSETMIEELLRARPDRSRALRILDLGTGSGCLLLSALREYGQASGVGVDRSVAALAVASQNAVRLEMTARSAFMQSSWCAQVEGRFDVVLSNPPYIPTAEIATLDADVRVHEPYAALDGGADGLECYRELLDASDWSADQSEAPRCGLMARFPLRQGYGGQAPGSLMPYLNPGALVLFEVGMGQAENVAALGIAQGLALRGIVKDLAGIARIVAFENTDLMEDGERHDA